MAEGRPMRKYFMNLSKQTFEELGDGLVRVTDRDGKTGTFHVDGRWVEGEIRDVNLNMLIFTGGPMLPKEFNIRWGMLPVDPKRASGWPEPQEKYLKEKGIL